MSDSPKERMEEAATRLAEAVGRGDCLFAHQYAGDLADAIADLYKQQRIEQFGGDW